MTYPTPEEITHIMEITGMDYIQARSHLIGRALVREIADEYNKAIRRAAANLTRQINGIVMDNIRKAQP